MTHWLPIESNPEVMNKFLHEAGLSKKWAIADVFGLDPEILTVLEQPVLALLLLFPVNEKVRTPPDSSNKNMIMRSNFSTTTC